MAYLLHKYLSRKHQDRKATRNVDGIVAEQLQITQAQTNHEPETRPAGASRTAIMKTVLLMVGLALPVILETLDYTSASESSFQTRFTDDRKSRRNGANTYCCTEHTFFAFER